MKLGLPYVPLRGVRGGRNVRKKAASVIAIAGAFVSLHIYSAPLGVVVGCATWRRLEGRLAAVEGLSIQDPASELRGIPLPRCEYPGGWLWATPRSGLTLLPRGPSRCLGSDSSAGHPGVARRPPGSGAAS